jgi:hypothetical protein
MPDKDKERILHKGGIDDLIDRGRTHCRSYVGR